MKHMSVEEWQLAWAEHLNGVLDDWCMFWPAERRQHTRAEFLDWMRACATADNRMLHAYADTVATALGSAMRRDWHQDQGLTAYVMCRNVFFDFVAAEHHRRFPIHGPWPEVADVPF